jgi:hypothetical protein
MLQLVSHCCCVFIVVLSADEMVVLCASQRARAATLAP